MVAGAGQRRPAASAARLAVVAPAPLLIDRGGDSPAGLRLRYLLHPHPPRTQQRILVLASAMPTNSAGILMYQCHGDEVRVLLAHPGGPFWRNRDDGAWSIPKGEAGTGEAPEQVARREFQEELGAAASGPLTPLGRLRQRGGKWVEAFALPGDFDVGGLRSNEFEVEWPPRSGKRACFPEVDRAAWFALPQARRKILVSQQVLLDRLEALLRESPGRPGPHP